MPSDDRPAFPHTRCYVVKLHRDADPGAGQLRGRIEHVASGEAAAFESAAALESALLRHAAALAAADSTPPPEET